METIAMPLDELEQARAAARRFGAETSLDLMTQEYWHRVDVSKWNGHMELVVHSWKVLRRTKHGVWLDGDGTGVSKRWVSNTAEKRYAYPTQELAMRSFIRRKKRQIFIVERILDDAKRALSMAQSGAVTVYSDPFQFSA